MNMAENAEAFSEGKHDGFEATAWQGLQESIEVIASKGIKVVINGGALNPKGLAQKTCALVRPQTWLSYIQPKFMLLLPDLVRSARYFVDISIFGCLRLKNEVSTSRLLSSQGMIFSQS